MKLHKDRKFLANSRAALTVDLSSLIKRDKLHGTFLRSKTLRAISDSWDSWAFYKRSGIMVEKEVRVLITWDNIARLVGLDPVNKTNFTKDEKGEMIAFAEKKLEEWLLPKVSNYAAQVVQLDDKTKKQITTLLHQVFDKFDKSKTNQMKLESLAAFGMALSTDDDVDLEELKNNMKAVINLLPEVFDLGRGPAPTVVRLKSKSGKETGAKLPESTANGAAGSHKKFQRFMAASFRKMGIHISKQQFELVKRDLQADAVDEEQMKAWQAKHN
jgi:hypothetical protein